MSATAYFDRNLARLRDLVTRTVGETEARIYLFGSCARGEARVSSDVDLAVEAVDCAAAVARTLRAVIEESDLPLTVQIVDLAEASEAIRESVAREGVVWIG